MLPVLPLTPLRTALLALGCAVTLGSSAVGQETPPGAPLISPPLSAEAFAARVTGRTFFYTSGGESYGAEQYLPDHRVVWAFTGEDCTRGQWYEKNGQICFSYEDQMEEQCWTFHDSPSGLTAYFLGDQTLTPLVALQQSPAPMACMGPDVGV